MATLLELQAQLAKSQAPRAQAPRAQAPKVQTPKVQAPKVQAPKVQAPKVQTLKALRAQASDVGLQVDDGQAAAFDLLEREGWRVGLRISIGVHMGSGSGGWRSQVVKLGAKPRSRFSWSHPYGGLLIDGVTHQLIDNLTMEKWTVSAVKAVMARFPKECSRVRAAIDALYVSAGKVPPEAYTISYNHGDFSPHGLAPGRSVEFSWKGGGYGTVSASRPEDAILLARAKGIIFSAFHDVEGSSHFGHSPLVFDESAGFRLDGNDRDAARDVVCAKHKGAVFAYTARDRKAGNFFCPSCSNDQRKIDLEAGRDASPGKGGDGIRVVRDPTLDWVSR